MHEIPQVNINDPHVWSEQDRERIADYLETVARQIRDGVVGTVPPGQIATQLQAEPVRGMSLKLICTRPGPLPSGPQAAGL